MYKVHLVHIHLSWQVRSDLSEHVLITDHKCKCALTGCVRIAPHGDHPQRGESTDLTVTDMTLNAAISQ